MDKKLKDDIASVLTRLREMKTEYFLVVIDKDDPDNGFKMERYAGSIILDRIAMKILRKEI